MQSIDGYQKMEQAMAMAWSEEKVLGKSSWKSGDFAMNLF